MDFSELIKKRYSCRKFSDKPVEKEKIVQCIEAARIAPSACNAQPWQFIVINDDSRIKEVSSKATSGIYRFARFIKDAPVLIVIIANKGTFLAQAGSFIRNTNFYLLDIGIACEHIVLQATELGLGTCYIGWFNEKNIKTSLGIPKNMIVPLLICMGYPDDSYRSKDPIRHRAQSDRRKPIENTILFDRYE
ncbi:nitroreductase family protein [Elusimicrobiota bacterium]